MALDGIVTIMYLIDILDYTEIDINCRLSGFSILIVGFPKVGPVKK